MSKYRQKPIILKQQRDVNPKNLEKVLQHIDNQIREQDNRRIKQQTSVTEGETDADTIQNILSSINKLIVALNKSELTED